MSSHESTLDTPYPWPVKEPPPGSIVAFARHECPTCGGPVGSSGGYVICSACEVQFDPLHRGRE